MGRFKHLHWGLTASLLIVHSLPGAARADIVPLTCPVDAVNQACLPEPLCANIGGTCELLKIPVGPQTLLFCPCFKNGAVIGDPHIVTFDGAKYDFMAAGEYWLYSSPDYGVQARFEPMDSLPVSVATAAVAKVQDDKIGMYVRCHASDSKGTKKSCQSELKFNDQTYPLTTASLNLESEKSAVQWASPYLTISEKNGKFATRFSLGGFYLGIRVYQNCAADVSPKGLLGNSDSNPNNDFADRSGRALARPANPEQLYAQYGENWRVTKDESLFDYLPGESTETFVIKDFPAIRTKSLADSQKLIASHSARAHALCEEAGISDPYLKESCMLDVGLTGDESFVAEYRDGAGALNTSKANLPATATKVAGGCSAAGNGLSSAMGLGLLGLALFLRQRRSSRRS